MEGGIRSREVGKWEVGGWEVGYGMSDYLIDQSKNQALFLELNTIAKRPNPRVVDFEKVEQFGNGEHHTVNNALTIFQRLESSSFVRNKFLIQKALELLTPLNH